MKKLYALISILLFMPAISFGQGIAVKSFRLAETDLTANIPDTMVYDSNGNVCALIKLETPEDGFVFDVGMYGIVNTKRVGGEIWIYVPHGIRKITISHQELQCYLL
jgi:hypothetical protein